MTSLDNIFVPLSKDLIDKYGASATLRREERTYSVATGKNTVTTTSYSIKISPPAPHSRERGGDEYEDGEMRCMVASSGLTVVPNSTTDKLVYNSTVWQIVGVSPVSSGESIAAYILTLRQ